MPASEEENAVTPIPIDLLHDFGGQGPLIHLAHANGFPPGTYTPFAQALAAAASASQQNAGQTYHVEVTGISTPITYDVVMIDCS